MAKAHFVTIFQNNNNLIIIISILADFKYASITFVDV